ncbi:MAG: hypothetical protein ACTSWG_10350 [Candidatus Helarchaeota archaeon]
MIPDILGWIANIFFIYGVWAIGIKKIEGFYANIIANLLYAIQSIIMNNTALFWLSIGLILLNMKGIYEWRIIKPKRNKLKESANKEYIKAVLDYNGD